MLTPDILKRIAPAAKAGIIEAAAPVFDLWWPRIAVTTRLRQAHFLAQIAHESDQFRTTEEYASGRAYEGRKDLRNTESGDGMRFKGRGLIQVTGRANYREFTAWVWRFDPTAPNFEREPTALATFPWAAVSAVWFWSTRALNAFADRDDLRAVTKTINGGWNGLPDRARLLTRAKEALLASPASPAAPIQQAAPLRRGDQGARVVQLQRNLGELGYAISVDGDFGPATEGAVRAFQTAHGLTADGVVGNLTSAAIVEAISDRRA